MAPGSSREFIVRVLTHDVEVVAITLSISFDPLYLGVTDSDTRPFAPGVQIQSHPENPLTWFIVENVADDTNGTIRYTAGSENPVSTDFNLAVITFKAKGVPTPSGEPTRVVFIVRNGDETVAAKSGQQLLNTKEDFIGASVIIGGS